MHARKAKLEALAEGVNGALLARTRSIIHALNLTQDELAQQTGVHQSQICRILAGRFRKLSGNARRVMEYANHRAAAAGFDPGESDVLKGRLQEAALIAWDGTEEGCDTLVEVLTALSKLCRQPGRPPR